VGVLFAIEHLQCTSERVSKLPHCASEIGLWHPGHGGLLQTVRFAESCEFLAHEYHLGFIGFLFVQGVQNQSR